MWLTKISVQNYRAFLKQEDIEIKPNHHLLIYGENGSGKSSLYKSIRTLLKSSEDLNPGETEFENNIYIPTGNNGFVEVQLADQTTFRFSISEGETTTLGQSLLINAIRLNSFLDYKSLLPIYTGGVGNATDTSTNVFNLFIRNVIANYRVIDPRGGVQEVRIIDAYNQLSTILTSRNRGSKLSNETISQLNTLYISIKDILDRIFVTANTYLNDYFENKLIAAYVLSPFALSGQSGPKVMSEVMTLSITQAGEIVDHYHLFLNEARLSALAISLYLASVEEGMIYASDLRLLYLDDVFIGMDMSNREPLMNILVDKFLKTATPFQLIMSTYDRNWHHRATDILRKKGVEIQSIEMYAHEDNLDEAKLLFPGLSGNPDAPYIWQRSSDEFERAKDYFDNYDYQSAALNLRIYCEKKVKKLIPQHRRYEEDSRKGIYKPIHSIGDLLNRFRSYLRDSGLPTVIADDVLSQKDRLLNPMAHDDSKASFYRSEVRLGINAVTELHAVDVFEVQSIEEHVDRQFVFQYDGVNYDIEVLETIRGIQLPGADRTVLVCRCKLDGAVHPSLSNALIAKIRALTQSQVHPPLDDIYQMVVGSDGVSIFDKLQAAAPIS